MAFLNLGAGITGGKIGPTEPPDGSYLEPEFADAFNTWKGAPTPENMSTMLGHVDPIIHRTIKTYAPSSLDSKGQPSPIMYSKARMMAVDALKGYDPSKSKIKTHLMSQMQSLRRQAVKADRVIRAPEHLLLEQHRLHTAQAQLADDLGREPSDMELADHTGISTKRMKYVRSIRDAMPSSFYSGMRKDEEGVGIDPAVKRRSDDNSAWHDMIYHSLTDDPRGQLIMEHTLGLHGKPVLPNQDIAKMLRLSPAAVSLRKQKIQEMIDQRDELGVL